MTQGPPSELSNLVGFPDHILPKSLVSTSTVTRKPTNLLSVSLFEFPYLLDLFFFSRIGGV